MSKVKSILVGVVVVLGAAAAASFPWWRDSVFPSASANAEDDHHHDTGDNVKISPQARLNLNLVVDAVHPVKTPFVTHVALPGWVVERPGSCERVVAAPIGGVIDKLTVIRGDLVKPGGTLFTIRIVSEAMHATQASLYKLIQEHELAKMEKDRLEIASKSGAVPPMRLAEIENQLKIREAGIHVLTQQLRLAGFTKEDIAKVSSGKLVSTITLTAPDFPEHDQEAHEGLAHDHVYEVEELKVLLGESVQPGQPLCVLADHQMLWIEGKVFATEAELVQRAAREGWPVQVRQGLDRDDALPTGVSLKAAKPWPPLPDDLRIVSVSNRVEADPQTLSFFVALPNPFQEFKRGGKTFRLWQFHPGQRLELRLPTGQIHDVFVLPAAAVVREGAETYVFRENGDFFRRIPVHVVREDRSEVLVANDGSLLPGARIALRGAIQLNWALRIQQSGDAGGHHHHDH